MDYHCSHCGEDLDGGDIYEHFLAETSNPVKALKIAKEYGWSETNKIRFVKSVMVQPDRDPQFEICPACKQKNPFTPKVPPASG